MPSEARIPGRADASWSSWAPEVLASYFPDVMGKVEVLGPWRCIEINTRGRALGLFSVHPPNSPAVAVSQPVMLISDPAERPIE